MSVVATKHETNALATLESQDFGALRDKVPAAHARTAGVLESKDKIARQVLLDVVVIACRAPVRWYSSA